MSELQELAVFFVEQGINVETLLQEKKRTFSGLLGEIINDAYKQLPPSIRKVSVNGNPDAPDGVAIAYHFGDEEKDVNFNRARMPITRGDTPFLRLYTYAADDALYVQNGKLEVACSGRIGIGTNHEHSGCFKGGIHHEKELAWKAAQELAGYISRALISKRLEHTLRFYRSMSEMENISRAAKYSDK